MMALIKTRSPGIAMPKSSPAHKEKKTFSLSRQSVMFLEALRKERRSRSMSASVTRYYDSLTSEEIAEDSAWGDFAATQFPSED
jgi:hypothetical protein